MSANSTETELKLLIDILDKKSEELEIILAISENQEVILGQPAGTERASMFKEMSGEKQKHIEEVLKCDSVFQTIFDSIKFAIEGNSSLYRDYLLVMQQKIDFVLEADVKIRAQESKNREILHNQMPMKKTAKAVPNSSKQRLLSQYKQNSKI